MERDITPLAAAVISDDGQTLAEYGLILGGIFLIAAAAMLLLGPTIDQLFQDAINVF